MVEYEVYEGLSLEVEYVSTRAADLVKCKAQVLQNRQIYNNIHNIQNVLLLASV